MKRLLIRLTFIVFWVALAVVLTVGAALVCTVKLLNPERLTPLVTRLAEKNLDADVTLGRAVLDFNPAFPVLRLRLDSLDIVSRVFADLPPDERSALPVYADSLFRLESFEGRVDVGALLTRGEIALRDVVLRRPGLNLVLDRNGRGNFDIYHTDTSAVADDGTPAVIPPFSIGRFAFEEPREIRWYNAADSLGEARVRLQEAELDGSGQPLYNIAVDGCLTHGMIAGLLNRSDFAFGLDGRVRWEPEHPAMVSFEEFKVRGAFVEGTVDAALRFDSTLTVESGRLAVGPVAISDFATLLTEEMKRDFGLAGDIASDGAVSLRAELTRPFSPSTDTIPYADIDIALPDCRLTAGPVRLENAALDLGVGLRGNELDSATVSLRRLALSGPATALDISGEAGRLMSDPAFDAVVKGRVSLGKLPPIIADMAKGYIAGRLDMELRARGTASMLTADRFHALDVRGRLDGDDLYYLSNDTAVMADVRHIDFDFGSKLQRSDSTGTMSAPTLAARIMADTANVLVDGITMRLADLRLGAGIENAGRRRDTTAIVPIGGGISIGRLNILSITDSAGVRMRDMKGNVSLRRYRNHSHRPTLAAKLDIRRLLAGTPDTRFVLSRAALDVEMHQRPQFAERRERMKKLVDSLSTAHPDLSPDSVYALALAKRRHRTGAPRPHRVHTAVDSTDTEMLDWGLSKGFKRFLLGWDINGSIATRSARLVTPLFPLRNRVRNLDLRFTSDSVVLKSVKYRAGNSDLSMKGIISNLRRGLTSKRRGNSLKINIDISSDTIDVNQLASAAFAGAAYAERLRKGEAPQLNLGVSDDDSDDEELVLASMADSTATGPLLIPVNLDGRLDVEARHVLYSDLLLHDLRGELLLYGGALNLHDLAATSDAGSVGFSALYSAPHADDIKLGFGLDLRKFRIERFLKLVPAIDSIMPLMRDFSGIISADIAATVDIDSSMNMVLPTLDAAVKLSGDSLALINPDTYRTLGKWLRFKDRADNKIKHMTVEMLVQNNEMQIFPFEFDIDRYRLGVAGSNDLALNFNYHIAVLKSPLPFKFGINLSGNPDKYKVRFGGAKFKAGEAARTVAIVDTARVNLINQIEGIFRRGVANSKFARLSVDRSRLPQAMTTDTVLTASDSLALIKEGILEAPAAPPAEATPQKQKGRKKQSKNQSSDTQAAILPADERRNER